MSFAVAGDRARDLPEQGSRRACALHEHRCLRRLRGPGCQYRQLIRIRPRNKVHLPPKARKHLYIGP
eukprot:8430558-Pyramimonas_sp.AAC.1